MDGAVDKPEKVFGVYTHAKPDGTVFYVGKGTIKRSRELRYGRNDWHRKVIAKYGAEHIIIAFFRCTDETAAFAEECRLIRYYKSLGNPIVNMTDGGEGASGHVKSPETIAKHKKSATGWKQTEEAKQRIRRAHVRLANNPEYRKKLSDSQKGRTVSLEHRAKIAATLKGRKIPPEIVAKISAKLRGRKRDPEVVAKIAAIHKGREIKPEWRAKISNTLKHYFAEHPEALQKLKVRNLGKTISEVHKKALSAPEVRARVKATKAARRIFVQCECCGDHALRQPCSVYCSVKCIKKAWYLREKIKLEQYCNIWSLLVGYLLATLPKSSVTT